MKKFEQFTNENLNLSNNFLMGKNILSEDCEYYGDRECFTVYNKKEDWYIKCQIGLSSTDNNWKKGIHIDLYTNITNNGSNWDNVFLGYGEWELDDDMIIDQSEFLEFFNNAIN